MTLANSLADETAQGWIGRQWQEAVGADNGTKVERMLQDAATSGLAAYRQFTQTFPSGRDVPLEFSVVRLGDDGGLLAIGRNLDTLAELQSRLVAAQQAMERDYWKLRELESRYRLLFDTSIEAVIMVTADTLLVQDANSAAIRLLGPIQGREVTAGIRREDRAAFQSMLAQARQSGSAPRCLIHIGGDEAPTLARASLVAGEGGHRFMLQLAETAVAPSPQPRTLEQFAESLPDGILITDSDGTIRRANRAFLDLVETAAEGAVVGQSLGRWLSRPGADWSVLLATLRQHGVVRRFSTTLQGMLGTDTTVEIAAVGNGTVASGDIALVVRDISRRMPETAETHHLRAAFSSIIEQSVRTPLRTLVREAVGLVERHYIGAALELAEGNRTNAAEMLGLSRQGFYKKLAQYDLHDSDATAPG